MYRSTLDRGVATGILLILQIACGSAPPDGRLPQQPAPTGGAVAGSATSASEANDPAVSSLAGLGDPEPLVFSPPRVRTGNVGGVRLVHLQDRSLPLVSLYALFEGGYSRLDRSLYAPATALPGLLRTGGTDTLAPDSVDKLVEFYALQMSFGQSGSRASSSINVLTEHLDVAAALWGDLLKNPKFDQDAIEVWRGRQLESVRRRRDSPGLLAVSEFNRLMYGNHPIGWEMEADDLTPERLSPDRFARVHQAVICPENVIFGAAGDVTWERAAALVEALLEDWPPCSGMLGDEPEPRVRTGGGVFLIPKALSQSTIVLGQPSDLHLSDDPEYFAAQVGNSILGSGGFTSRLMARVRTEAGYAYGASSIWTTPRKERGILGALTQTSPETTVDAARLVLEVLEGMTGAPPDDEEVQTVVDQIVNGFVFSFERAGQIVSRQMAYLAQDLPEDWLERYLAGIQGVTPMQVQEVFNRYYSPDDIAVLVVGDSAAIEDLERLGPVTVLDETGQIRPAGRP